MFASRFWLPVVLSFTLLIPSIAAAQLGGGGAGPPDVGRSNEIDFRSRVIDAGGPQYRPEDEGKLIVAVRIIGNQSMTERDIRSQLRVREERRFDAETIQADVRRLISSGRLRDVRTFTEEVPEGIVVTFQVEELPTVRYLRVHGNRGYFDRMLLRQTGLSVGDSLNRFAVEEGRRRMEEFYRDKGYPYAEVRVISGSHPADEGVEYEVSEGVRPRIAKVEIIGNSFVPAARLKALLRSKATILGVIRGTVDDEQIEQDVERLTTYYRNYGFFRARVGRVLDYDANNRWLELRFVVDEGPRYAIRSVTVEGNQRFTAESLLAQLEVEPGEFFNLSKMNRDVNSLRDAYGVQGHIFADIEAAPRFDIEPGVLDLVYRIEEGEAFRVGRVNVHITGESPHTRRSVIFNRLSVRPGELCNIREIRNSERRLISSQLFEHEPSRGITPRIVIRPPDLTEIERLSQGDQIRGQSPPGRY